MQGYWYVTGQLTPYTPRAPNLYTPLFFYEVGIVQKIFGLGHVPGRLFSACCELISIGLIFSLGRRLADSTIAGLGATALFVGQNISFALYATATPYAIISMLSLVLLYLLVLDWRRCD